MHKEDRLQHNGKEGMFKGSRQIRRRFIDMENFLHIWPRNFAIAFWIVLLFTQPIARFVMKKRQIAQQKQAA